MTLEQAVDCAFGKSRHVRRTEWDPGLVAPILLESNDPHPAIGTAFGPARVVLERPTAADYRADDWQPCGVNGAPPTEDWSQLLAVGTGIDLSRSDRCTVRIDDPSIGRGPAFPGDWRLVWMTPGVLWLSADAKLPQNWATEDKPLHVRISIGGRSGERLLNLTRARTERAVGDRIFYRLDVHAHD